MEPKRKIYGANEIVVCDRDNGKEVSIGTVITTLSDVTDNFMELSKAAKALTIAFTTAFRIDKKKIRQMQYAFGILKSPKYYRTGILPNIHNRTKKKQCLTRLQRRQKRQR